MCRTSSILCCFGDKDVRWPATYRESTALLRSPFSCNIFNLEDSLLLFHEMWFHCKANLPNKGCVIHNKTLCLTDEYTHTEITRWAQACHNLTRLWQPGYNLVTGLSTCHKVVTTLSRPCNRIVNLSQSCDNLVKLDLVTGFLLVTYLLVTLHQCCDNLHFGKN